MIAMRAIGTLAPGARVRLAIRIEHRVERLPCNADLGQSIAIEVCNGRRTSAPSRNRYGHAHERGMIGPVDGERSA
jgi:hypothetical protein